MQTELKLVIRDSCTLCDKVYEQLLAIQSQEISFHLQIVNLYEGEEVQHVKGYFITPSLFINNQLWTVGEIDIRGLINKLNSIHREILNVQSNYSDF